jgi:hypothetical protein
MYVHMKNLIVLMDFFFFFFFFLSNNENLFKNKKAHQRK